ncbi:hypothetical protein CB1_000281003 [Camelus ferus]|nr:hypothetical protein CB1_000281003 [Camelus ferus]
MHSCFPCNLVMTSMGENARPLVLTFMPALTAGLHQEGRLSMDFATTQMRGRAPGSWSVVREVGLALPPLVLPSCQRARYIGPSTVLGSSGELANVEQWRCVSILRSHSGDVMDVAWSPHDAWLASCSVDNTVVIWNAVKFPGLASSDWRPVRSTACGVWSEGGSTSVCQ